MVWVGEWVGEAFRELRTILFKRLEEYCNTHETQHLLESTLGNVYLQVNGSRLFVYFHFPNADGHLFVETSTSDVHSGQICREYWPQYKGKHTLEKKKIMNHDYRLLYPLTITTVDDNIFRKVKHTQGCSIGHGETIQRGTYTLLLGSMTGELCDLILSIPFQSHS